MRKELTTISLIAVMQGTTPLFGQTVDERGDGMVPPNQRLEELMRERGLADQLIPPDLLHDQTTGRPLVLNRREEQTIQSLLSERQDPTEVLIGQMISSDDPDEIASAIRIAGVLGDPDADQLVAAVANLGLDPQYTAYSLEAVGRWGAAIADRAEIQTMFSTLLREGEPSVQIPALSTALQLNVWNDDIHRWCTGRIEAFDAPALTQEDRYLDLLSSMRLAVEEATAHDSLRVLAAHLQVEDFGLAAAIMMVDACSQSDVAQEHYQQTVQQLDDSELAQLADGFSSLALVQESGDLIYPPRRPFRQDKIRTGPLWEPGTPVRDVFRDVEGALKTRRVNCREISYHAINGGIALVTGRERIDENGDPIRGPGRWSSGLDGLSWWQKAKLLITRKIADHRVFLFVLVDPEQDRPLLAEMSYTEARRWFANGVLNDGVQDFGQLGAELQDLTLGNAVLEFYVYHLEEYVGGHIEPIESPLRAWDHLVRVRLWEQLEDLRIIRQQGLQ